LEQPIAVIESVLIVNPMELLSAVEAHWKHFLNQLRSDVEIHHSTAKHIERVFKADFSADKAWNT
jgi:hypothetical protein